MFPTLSRLIASHAWYECCPYWSSLSLLRCPSIFWDDLSLIWMSSLFSIDWWRVPWDGSHKKHYPSGDLCDFHSCSVTDLTRILQGTTLFPWGNDEFLEEACNREVPEILSGFVIRFSSEKVQRSILFEPGSYSRCCIILVEACNWEFIENLTRFLTRLNHDPFRFFTEEWHNLLRILMGSESLKSDTQD